MKPQNILYYIAIILVIIWVLGFFVLHNTKPLLHLLLVLSVIAILLRIIQGGNYK
ncbi:MAG: lmo0937 family membrane protein [Nanoarchaeota archaeon]